jgi:hypothetical protein
MGAQNPISTKERNLEKVMDMNNKTGIRKKKY